MNGRSNPFRGSSIKMVDMALPFLIRLEDKRLNLVSWRTRRCHFPASRQDDAQLSSAKATFFIPAALATWLQVEG